MNASDRERGSNVESTSEDGMEQGLIELPVLLQARTAGGEIPDGCQIFPEEVWKIIFEKLTNPGDLWNLSNTCKLFEVILRPWKSGWMLEQSLPYLYHYLPGNKLLECRLVSKSWNAGVDSFLENHTSLQPYVVNERDPRRIDFVYPLKEKSICLKNIFNFSNCPEDNSAALEDPRFPWKVGRNPFIGRYVTLLLGQDLNSATKYEDHAGDPWWDRLFAFLDSYGREIWYLHLEFPSGPNESVKVKLVDFMHSKLFQAVPNLKKLSIEFRYLSLNEDGLYIDLLPAAPNLETIEIPDPCLTEFNVISVLIQKYGNQLRKLHFTGMQHRIISGMTLDNIQELVLDMGTDLDGDDEISREVSESIQSLLEVRMPNLNMLQLKFPIDGGYEYALEDLLKVINKLTTSTKLTTLRLAGALWGLREASEEELDRTTSDSPQFSLEPSTLKILEIDFGWECWGGDHYEGNALAPNYNFVIRCFPNLENLAIFARNDPKDYEFPAEINLMPHAECARRWSEMNTEEEVLELHKYMHRGDMYKSNIWELLPRLRVFSYQWMVFTREEYEAYSRLGNEVLKN